jgi:hypothetical protein
VNLWNDQFQKALAHSVKRRIIECLTESNLSFTELLDMVGAMNHGGFGYHLRGLKEFVELEPSTMKYRLTDRGSVLAGLIRDFRLTTSVNTEYAKYVQNLRFGDHAVAFYTSEDFKRKLSFPYLKAGLLKNEAVVYIVSENKVDSEIREIQRYGIDLSNLPKEAFTIMSAYQWYLEDGKAQAETIIANWSTLLKEKEKSGFTGLRVAGETDAFVDYAKISELLRYEKLFGRQLAMNICALCLYDRDRFDEGQFIQACNSHGHIISKGIAGKMIP